MSCYFPIPYDYNLNDISKRNQFDEKPSESTIEVKAEEIK